jgi:hypothetical protein
MSRPGWYPDPSGRYPRRWFDGTDWTASVLGANGQQGYDELPPAAAPGARALTAGSPLPPPPPPSQPTTVPPPPAGPPATWPPSTSRATPWQPELPPGTQRQQQSSRAPSPWEPTTGYPPAPASGAAPARRRASSLGAVVVGVAVALWVLSLFVLDWVDGVTFTDFRHTIPPVDGPIDNLVKANVLWLAFAWAGLATLVAVRFVIGRAGSPRFGHVSTALVAAVGAVMSTLVIVRIFRGPGPDPELGAWLLPAGHLLVVAAAVISARKAG